MSKVAVTGSAGFIGRALTSMLISAGHQVVTLSRAQPLQESLIRDSQAIVHLAARAHVMRESHPDPLAEFRRVNVDGTLAAARLAALAGAQRFIFVSSIGVLGNSNPAGPFTERDPPSPEGPYATSKYEAEVQLAEFAAQSGLEVVIVRPPLVYGPGVKGNFLRLLRLVSSGVPLPFGALHNLRSYVGLDNVCGLLMTCAFHPAAGGGVFHVADGEDVSTANLVRMIADAMRRRPVMIPVPVALLHAAAALLGKQSELRRLSANLQVDAALAGTILGWRPTQDLRTGVASMVEDFEGAH
jgi:nucleoside-diphosphate-sugar epimerase